MPSISINSVNIGVFSFKITADIYSRRFILDTTASTYQGGGFAATQGICFFVQDQDGVILSAIDFTQPAIPNTSINPVYILDLSNVNYSFLFQNYQIFAAIKDGSGTVYQTIPIYKTICQPVDITDNGYVPGVFRLTPNCPANTLTIQEYTLLTYNSKSPLTVNKSGTLYYPTGTIAQVNFTGTPFTNNQVYSGAYRISCTTVATYYFLDDFYVSVTYLTTAPFNITCATKIADLLCCIEQTQQTYLKNFDNAKGQNAKQLLDQIDLAFTLGWAKEINGQDSSREAEYIRKTLSCDCGINSISQNESLPVNASINHIVVVGANAINVTPSTNGNTVTYTADSNFYQVSKGDTGDLSYTITQDNSVPGTTKYVITFNPVQQAINIMDAIAANPSLQTQLNSLITDTSGVNLSGLDGVCVIDLTQSDYIITQLVTNSMLVGSVVINGTTYNAPGGLLATNTTAIASWLNTLTLGTFSVSISSLVLLVQTLSNTNTVSTITFSNPALTVQFVSTNATLVQVLQAIINSFCSINASKMALGSTLSLCQFDYNGSVININYSATDKQNVFNSGLAATVCNLASRINSINGNTCASIKSIFSDISNGVFGGADRFYGTLGSACAGITDQQAALAIISAVGKYDNVKAAWCAINCTSPGTCPDITGINMAIVGGNIGIYGVTLSGTPAGSQTLTVRYKIHSASSYTISTSSLLVSPTGNVSGSSPYNITGVSAGQIIDVYITNNCGGGGFVGQIQIPSGTVYSGSFLLDTVIGNICDNSAVLLYSSSPFATGVTMYTDSGLTTPVSGFNFIASSGQIYAINSLGVVGANTGNNCSAGTPGPYRVDNSTSTICSSGTITLYTNGVFAVGGTVYIDSALTTPKTGFTFILNLSDGIIYNLNSSTGQIGSSTGAGCSGSPQVTIANNLSVGGSSITSVTGISGYTLPGPVTAGNANIGTHTAFTGAITVQYSGSGPVFCLYKNGSLLASITTNGTGTYVLPSNTYGGTDAITITLTTAGC